MPRPNETFLGDGLFASYDGYHVKLRAPQPQGEDMAVYLDDRTLVAFLDYIDILTGKKKPLMTNEEAKEIFPSKEDKDG
jgi:hypothetical protein